jgi:hypothetical protein
MTETDQGLQDMAIQDRNAWLDEYQAMIDEAESLTRTTAERAEYEAEQYELSLWED